VDHPWGSDQMLSTAGLRLFVLVAIGSRNSGAIWGRKLG